MNYYETANVGKAKYVVSFHDGVKTHADGSKFYDVRLFGNKREKDAFIRGLARTGYTQREATEIVCPNCGVKASEHKPCGSFAKAQVASCYNSQTPNWELLEHAVAQAGLPLSVVGEFMWMGEWTEGTHSYKHRDTRKYVRLTKSTCAPQLLVKEARGQ